MLTSFYMFLLEVTNRIIGGRNRGVRGPWPLLNFRPLHRNVIFATENCFSLGKVAPLISVASSSSESYIVKVYDNSLLYAC